MKPGIACVDSHVKYLDRILLNTDSGEIFYDDLLNLVQQNGPEVKRKVDLTRTNACRFFGIPSPPWQGSIQRSPCNG